MRKPLLPKRPDTRPAGGAADRPRSIHELNSDLFAPADDDRLGNPKQARRKAMDFLARREYGRRELVARLAGAGFDADLAEAAVAQLAAEGLQDDRRFVESFVQSRVSQGKGPVRIQADLGQRGLPGGLVDEVLQDSETDWYALAREVRRKKFGDGLPSDFKDKARQMRFLQYRGFESAQVQAALRSTDED